MRCADVSLDVVFDDSLGVYSCQKKYAVDVDEQIFSWDARFPSLVEHDFSFVMHYISMMHAFLLLQCMTFSRCMTFLLQCMTSLPSHCIIFPRCMNFHINA